VPPWEAYFGGGSASTSRRNELSAIGNLLGTAGWGQYGPGTKDVGSASTGLQNVSNFAQQLLSGGGTQLLAPQIGQIQGQAAQERATGAQFGTRSGGTAAANQAIDAQTNAQIDNLMAALTGTGLQAELAANQALGSLGLGAIQQGTQAATAAAGLSQRDYQIAKAQQQANIGAAIDLATLGAGGAMGWGTAGGTTGLEGAWQNITGMG
jgi:hypothetical protein